MEEAPENGKESPHSAHGNGMNKLIIYIRIHGAPCKPRNLNVVYTSIRRAQVKVGLINLCKGLFSLNARINYILKSGTLVTISV
jgi:hypothetical protein